MKVPTDFGWQVGYTLDWSPANAGNIMYRQINIHTNGQFSVSSEPNICVYYYSWNVRGSQSTWGKPTRLAIRAQNLPTRSPRGHCSVLQICQFHIFWNFMVAFPCAWSPDCSSLPSILQLSGSARPWQPPAFLCTALHNHEEKEKKKKISRSKWRAVVEKVWDVWRTEVKGGERRKRTHKAYRQKARLVSWTGPLKVLLIHDVIVWIFIEDKHPHASQHLHSLNNAHIKHFEHLRMHVG